MRSHHNTLLPTWLLILLILRRWVLLLLIYLSLRVHSRIRDASQRRIIVHMRLDSLLINELISDQIELLVELLDQVLVWCFHSGKLRHVAILLVHCLRFCWLLVLLQSLLSIFNELVCVLADSWFESRFFIDLLPVDESLLLLLLSLLLAFISIHPGQARCWLLQSRCQRLIHLIIDQPLHFLFKLLLFKSFLPLLEQLQRFFIDLWNLLPLFLF